MYIFVSWSLHQATCHHQSGCAEGNQPENFNLLVDMTIFFLLGVRTRASYVELVQFLPSFHSINILYSDCTVCSYCTYIRTYFPAPAGTSDLKDWNWRRQAPAIFESLQELKFRPCIVYKWRFSIGEFPSRTAVCDVTFASHVWCLTGSQSYRA